MSNLNKTAAAAVIDGRINEAVVGANRRLIRRGSDLVGAFYGYPIVTKTTTKLVVKRYGFATASARNAINDMLAMMGVKGKASFAGGAFTITVGDKLYATDGDQLEIEP